METVILNNGKVIPMEGYGVYRVTDLQECERVVYQDITLGYCLIDIAAVYQNEEAVGHAVKRAIDESLVIGGELFITMKLWLQDYDDVVSAIGSSLKNCN